MTEPRSPRTQPLTMNAQQLEALLPHRYPFALVDRILDYEPGQWAIGRKCVTRNEQFFCGHFPGQPVMPGVLLLEALAQTGAAAALSLPANAGKLALFGGVKMPGSAARSSLATCSLSTASLPLSTARWAWAPPLPGWMASVPLPQS